MRHHFFNLSLVLCLTLALSACSAWEGTKNWFYDAGQSMPTYQDRKCPRGEWWCSSEDLQRGEQRQRPAAMRSATPLQAAPNYQQPSSQYPQPSNIPAYSDMPQYGSPSYNQASPYVTPNQAPSRNDSGRRRPSGNNYEGSYATPYEAPAPRYNNYAPAYQAPAPQPDYPTPSSSSQWQQNSQMPANETMQKSASMSDADAAYNQMRAEAGLPPLPASTNQPAPSAYPQYQSAKLKPHEANPAWKQEMDETPFNQMMRQVEGMNADGSVNQNNPELYMDPRTRYNQAIGKAQ